MHACIHTDRQTYRNTYITYMYIYIYICVYIYIHTQIYPRCFSCPSDFFWHQSAIKDFSEAGSISFPAQATNHPLVNQTWDCGDTPNSFLKADDCEVSTGVFYMFYRCFIDFLKIVKKLVIWWFKLVWNCGSGDLLKRESHKPWGCEPNINMGFDASKV